MSLPESLEVVREVHGLSFTVKGRSSHGASSDGAWFATDDDGRPVVLKWFPDEGTALRYEMLERSLRELRRRGYPVPEHGPILVVPGATVIVQGVLPGITGHRMGPQVVERILELNELQADVVAPANTLPWGAFVRHSLLEGEVGWAMHEPLRLHSTRTRRLVERIERTGATCEARWFPRDGIVHLDLHQGNLLLDGDDSLSGVVDWDGACDGDHRFDLVTFAHNLESTGMGALAGPVWKTIEATVEPPVLKAYVTHLVLRLVDWQIRHDPADVTNQLDVGDRLLATYAT
jgi:hypothetical protein